MRALLIGAVKIILLHNHPSADCVPSMEDNLLTKSISKVNHLQVFICMTISLSAVMLISALKSMRCSERVVLYEMVQRC